MDVKTHLLALKLSRSHRSLDKHGGDVVFQWIIHVLAQHGIRDEDIAGAVTDAGSDVRSGVVSAWSWEWCFDHLLNRATIDATGMSPARDRQKNPQCRELLELIKGMVEHFNKSAVDKIALEDIIDEMSGGEGFKAKLSQAVAQRWISVCQMLLRVLERWGRPEDILLGQRVEEVYSIANEVKGVIVYSQTTYESTAQGGLQRLVLVATTALDPEKSLNVRHVRAVGQGTEDVEPEVRPSADLTSVAKVTREAFARGVARRFVS
ncbi:unnamed protein product, partial [Sphacelaria rigidula]